MHWGGCCSAHAEEGPRASLTAGLRPRACLLLLLRIELRRFTADRREQASIEPGDAAAGAAVVQGGSSRRRGFECAMSMVGCRRSSQRESSPSSSCRRRSRRAIGQVVRPPLGARERAWRHLPAGAPSDGRELAARVQVVVPAQRCRASEAPLDAVCPAAFGSRDAARQSPGEVNFELLELPASIGLARHRLSRHCGLGAVRARCGVAPVHARGRRDPALRCTTHRSLPGAALGGVL